MHIDSTCSWVAKFIYFKHWAQKFDEVNTHLSRLYYLEKIIDFFHITKKILLSKIEVCLLPLFCINLMITMMRSHDAMLGPP